MNRKLAEKMEKIVECFAKANAQLPVTNVRSNIKKVTFEGHEGIKIENIGNSNMVWGVTPREYWKYCKSVNN